METQKKLKSRKYYQIKHGFRSGLEEQIQDILDEEEANARYEEVTIRYTVPAKEHRYIPDWVLPNGVVIEAKGIFSSQDRSKHLLVRKQHPELDVRFVFYNANSKLNKRSTTTLADWAEKYGYKWCCWKKSPEVLREWLKEAKQLA